MPHLLIKWMQFERITFLGSILLESEHSLMFFSYVSSWMGTSFRKKKEPLCWHIWGRCLSGPHTTLHLYANILRVVAPLHMTAVCSFDVDFTLVPEFLASCPRYIYLGSTRLLYQLFSWCLSKKVEDSLESSGFLRTVQCDGCWDLP